MNIAIVGFGKLGQKIAELIEHDPNLTLKLTINSKNPQDFNPKNLENIDVAIELSGPNNAYTNLIRLAENNIATICGSTGWTEKYTEIEKIFKDANTGFLYASNFSLGMNIFFEINRRLAKLMNDKPFSAKVKEVHHIHKLDSPSGTSLSIANDLIAEQEKYTNWKLTEDKPNDTELEIEAERRGEVIGDHTVIYTANNETLSIHHSASDRAVFAEGALAAAKWIYQKSGIYSMNDVIGI